MKSFDLKGTARTEVGKKSTNELRKNNGIPCVLYGIEKEAQAFAVTTDAVRKLVYTPDIHLVNLTIDGKEGLRRGRRSKDSTQSGPRHGKWGKCSAAQRSRSGG